MTGPVGAYRELSTGNRWGLRHMILPKFPKNCMKLEKFWSVVGGPWGDLPYMRQWVRATIESSRFATSSQCSFR